MRGNVQNAFKQIYSTGETQTCNTAFVKASKKCDYFNYVNRFGFLSFFSFLSLKHLFQSVNYRPVYVERSSSLLCSYYEIQKMPGLYNC